MNLGHLDHVFITQIESGGVLMVCTAAVVVALIIALYALSAARAGVLGIAHSAYNAIMSATTSTAVRTYLRKALHVCPCEYPASPDGDRPI